eukprot:5464907-Karenia_brevis.AAC.1
MDEGGEGSKRGHVGLTPSSSRKAKKGREGGAPTDTIAMTPGVHQDGYEAPRVDDNDEEAAVEPG